MAGEGEKGWGACRPFTPLFAFMPFMVKSSHRPVSV